jgi:hypothetical protein
MTGQEKCGVCDFLIMDVSTINERLERTREKTQQAIRGTQELMRQTRFLVEQSQASCRASRALLEALEESLLIDQLDWGKPDLCPSVPNRP